jgi:hypothetical protein
LRFRWHGWIAAAGRITTTGWSRYDTRHAVFRPARMSAAKLEHGYRWAYRKFYRWGSILRGASAHGDALAGLRHLAYAAGWKKFEPLWDAVIRARRAGMMLPLLETILGEFGRRAAGGPEPARRAPDDQECRPAAAAALESAGLRAAAPPPVAL